MLTIFEYFKDQCRWIALMAYYLVTYMGTGSRWIIMAVRLITYGMLVTPAFLKHILWYISTSTVVRRVRYRSSKKVKLDIIKALLQWQREAAAAMKEQQQLQMQMMGISQNSGGSGRQQLHPSINNQHHQLINDDGDSAPIPHLHGNPTTNGRQSMSHHNDDGSSSSNKTATPSAATASRSGGGRILSNASIIAHKFTNSLEALNFRYKGAADDDDDDVDEERDGSDVDEKNTTKNKSTPSTATLTPKQEAERSDRRAVLKELIQQQQQQATVSSPSSALAAAVAAAGGGSGGIIKSDSVLSSTVGSVGAAPSAEFLLETIRNRLSFAGCGPADILLNMAPTSAATGANPMVSPSMSANAPNAATTQSSSFNNNSNRSSVPASPRGGSVSNANAKQRSPSPSTAVAGASDAKHRHRRGGSSNTANKKETLTTPLSDRTSSSSGGSSSSSSSCDSGDERDDAKNSSGDAPQLLATLNMTANNNRIQLIRKRSGSMIAGGGGGGGIGGANGGGGGIGGANGGGGGIGGANGGGGIGGANGGGIGANAPPRRASSKIVRRNTTNGQQESFSRTASSTSPRIHSHSQSRSEITREEADAPTDTEFNKRNNNNSNNNNDADGYDQEEEEDVSGDDGSQRGFERGQSAAYFDDDEAEGDDDQLLLADEGTQDAMLFRYFQTFCDVYTAKREAEWARRRDEKKKRIIDRLNRANTNTNSTHTTGSNNANNKSANGSFASARSASVVRGGDAEEEVYDDSHTAIGVANNSNKKQRKDLRTQRHVLRRFADTIIDGMNRTVRGSKTSEAAAAPLDSQPAGVCGTTTSGSIHGSEGGEKVEKEVGEEKAESDGHKSFVSCATAGSPVSLMSMPPSTASPALFDQTVVNQSEEGNQRGEVDENDATFVRKTVDDDDSASPTDYKKMTPTTNSNTTSDNNAAHLEIQLPLPQQHQPLTIDSSAPTPSACSPIHESSMMFADGPAPVSEDELLDAFLQWVEEQCDTEDVRVHNRATLDVFVPMPLHDLLSFMAKKKEAEQDHHRGHHKHHHSHHHHHHHNHKTASSPDEAAKLKKRPSPHEDEYIATEATARQVESILRGKSAKPFKVCIIISGGAWIIGCYLWSVILAKCFAAAGYVVFMPDYRNFPQTDISGMVEDVTDAVVWVLRNAAVYNGDPKDVTLIGHSAGAHLSLMTMLEQARACHAKDAFDEEKKRLRQQAEEAEAQRVKKEQEEAELAAAEEEEEEIISIEDTTTTTNAGTAVTAAYDDSTRTMTNRQATTATEDSEETPTTTGSRRPSPPAPPLALRTPPATSPQSRSISAPPSPGIGNTNPLNTNTSSNPLNSTLLASSFANKTLVDLYYERKEATAGRSRRNSIRHNTSTLSHNGNGGSKADLFDHSARSFSFRSPAVGGHSALSPSSVGGGGIVGDAAVPYHYVSTTHNSPAASPSLGGLGGRRGSSFSQRSGGGLLLNKNFIEEEEEDENNNAAQQQYGTNHHHLTTPTTATTVIVKNPFARLGLTPPLPTAFRGNKKPRFNPHTDIKQWIGVSGIYDLPFLEPHFNTRGLYSKVLYAVAGHWGDPSDEANRNVALSEGKKAQQQQQQNRAGNNSNDDGCGSKNSNQKNKKGGGESTSLFGKILVSLGFSADDKNKNNNKKRSAKSPNTSNDDDTDSSPFLSYSMRGGGGAKKKRHVGGGSALSRSSSGFSLTQRQQHEQQQHDDGDDGSNVNHTNDYTFDGCYATPVETLKRVSPWWQFVKEVPVVEVVAATTADGTTNSSKPSTAAAAAAARGGNSDSDHLPQPITANVLLSPLLASVANFNVFGSDNHHASSAPKHDDPLAMIDLNATVYHSDATALVGNSSIIAVPHHHHHHANKDKGSNAAADGASSGSPLMLSASQRNGGEAAAPLTLVPDTRYIPYLPKTLKFLHGTQDDSAPMNESSKMVKVIATAVRTYEAEEAEKKRLRELREKEAAEKEKEEQAIIGERNNGNNSAKISTTAKLNDTSSDATTSSPVERTKDGELSSPVEQPTPSSSSSLSDDEDDEQEKTIIALTTSTPPPTTTAVQKKTAPAAPIITVANVVFTSASHTDPILEEILCGKCTVLEIAKMIMTTNASTPSAAIRNPDDGRKKNTEKNADDGASSPLHSSPSADAMSLKQKKSHRQRVQLRAALREQEMIRRYQQGWLMTILDTLGLTESSDVHNCDSSTNPLAAMARYYQKRQDEANAKNNGQKKSLRASTAQSLLRGYNFARRLLRLVIAMALAPFFWLWRTVVFVLWSVKSVVMLLNRGSGRNNKHGYGGGDDDDGEDDDDFDSDDNEEADATSGTFNRTAKTNNSLSPVANSNTTGSGKRKKKVAFDDDDDAEDLIHPSSPLVDRYSIYYETALAVDSEHMPLLIRLARKICPF